MSYLSELTAHERLTVDNATLDMFTAFENGSDLIYDIWEQYFSDRERKNIESRDLEFIGRILYSVYDTARARRYRTTARSGRPTLTATCGSLGSTGGRSTSSPQRPVKPPRSPQETRTESRESNFTRRAKRQREGRQKPPLSESKKPALLRGSPRRFWGG